MNVLRGWPSANARSAGRGQVLEVGGTRYRQRIAHSSDPRPVTAPAHREPPPGHAIRSSDRPHSLRGVGRKEPTLTDGGVTLPGWLLVAGPVAGMVPVGHPALVPVWSMPRERFVATVGCRTACDRSAAAAILGGTVGNDSGGAMWRQLPQACVTVGVLQSRRGWAGLLAGCSPIGVDRFSGGRQPRGSCPSLARWTSLGAPSMIRWSPQRGC